MVQTRDELLTVKEAAALLKVSPFTIYRWIGAGRLRAVRLSPRMLRLSRSQIETLLGGFGRPLSTREQIDRAVRELEELPLYDENGEPRRGSPMALLKIAGIFKGDEEFANIMDDVVRERDRELIDSRSPFDELPG